LLPENVTEIITLDHANFVQCFAQILGGLLKIYTQWHWDLGADEVSGYRPHGSLSLLFMMKKVMV